MCSPWTCPGLVGSGANKVRGFFSVNRHLNQDDACSTTWWPVLSTDKCCQVTSSSIERTDHHILLKASCCLRSLIYDFGRGRGPSPRHYHPSPKNVTTIFETSDTQLLDKLCDINTEGKNDVRKTYSKWCWRKDPV